MPTPAAPPLYPGAHGLPGADLVWDGLVPLAQVLAYVRPAYGGDTWDEAFNSLIGEPSEWAVVLDLAQSGPGGFAATIRVDWDMEYDEDDDDDGRVVGLRVGNGMHRITTAYLLGHDTIRCRFGDVPFDDTDVEYVEVYYVLPDDGENRDVIDFAAGWLRSFPLPDGTWVETDLVSSSCGVLEGMWACPHDRADALVAELTKRAAMHGDGFEVKSMRCLTGAEWLAELDADLADA